MVFLSANGNSAGQCEENFHCSKIRPAEWPDGLLLSLSLSLLNITRLHNHAEMRYKTETRLRDPATRLGARSRNLFSAISAPTAQRRERKPFPLSSVESTVSHSSRRRESPRVVPRGWNRSRCISRVISLRKHSSLHLTNDSPVAFKSMPRGKCSRNFRT